MSFTISAFVRRWRGVLIACLGVVSAMPGVALATVRYVAPNGSAANTGLSPSSPWDLTKANASLVAGDVCYVLPGTYSGTLKPANHGTRTARITILGNIANPAAATINNGLECDRSYITFKGLKFVGPISLGASSPTNTASYDSAAYCIARNAWFTGSKHSIICHCTIINDGTPTGCTVGFVLDNWNDIGPRPFSSASEEDTLRRNIIDCGITSWKAFTLRTFTQRCLIDSNRIAIRWAGSNGDVGGRSIFNSYYNTFRDNHWTMEADNARPDGYPWYFCGLRDSSSYNVFERDTILAGLQSGFQMCGWLMQAGTWPGYETYNQFRHCVYRVTGYMWMETIGPRTLLDHSEFSSGDGPALVTNDEINRVTINHCTFYAEGGPVISLGSLDSSCPADSIRITNNVFYSKVADGTNGVIRFPATSGFVSHHNVFFSPSSSRVVGYGGAARTVADWCSLSGKDCNSVGGDPRFVNASSLGSLNAHLSAGSAALGVAESGEDAGAYPFRDGADTTPPAAVTDLVVGTVSDQIAVLNWTAPGDDGGVGVAAEYDLRMSQQVITEGGFAGATPLPGPPVPVGAGSAQSYVVLGLTPGTRYYFALRTRDDAGNWSAISNVPSATTDTADHMPPAAVDDLKANP